MNAHAASSRPFLLSRKLLAADLSSGILCMHVSWKYIHAAFLYNEGMGYQYFSILIILNSSQNDKGLQVMIGRDLCKKSH